jgi:hypothetical protein
MALLLVGGVAFTLDGLQVVCMIMLIAILERVIQHVVKKTLALISAVTTINQRAVTNTLQVV